MRATTTRPRTCGLHNLIFYCSNPLSKTINSRACFFLCFILLFAVTCSFLQRCIQRMGDCPKQVNLANWTLSIYAAIDVINFYLPVCRWLQSSFELYIQQYGTLSLTCELVKLFCPDWVTWWNSRVWGFSCLKERRKFWYSWKCDLCPFSVSPQPFLWKTQFLDARRWRPSFICECPSTWRSN